MTFRMKLLLILCCFFYSNYKSSAEIKESYLLLPRKKTNLPDHFTKVQTYLKIYELGAPVPKSILVLKPEALNRKNIDKFKQFFGDEYCSLRYQYITPVDKQIRGGKKTLLDATTLEESLNSDY